MNDNMEPSLYGVAAISPDSNMSAASLVREHESALTSVLSRLGFRNIRRPSAGLTLWVKKPAAGAPHLLATRNGRKACIYFGDAVTNYLELTTISDEACRYIDSHYETEDVYYGALIASEEEDGHLQLGFYGLALLRRDGAWCDGNPDSYQFLPLDKRRHNDRLTCILGGASFFKADMLARQIASKGKPLNVHITGLCTKEDMVDEYMACGVMPPPMLSLLCRKRDEEGHFDLQSMPFYSDGDPCSELEIVGMPPTDDPTQLTLMDETGLEFRVDCLEAVLLRSRLRCGQRFLWTLSMLADRCEDNTQEISITEGAFFEMEKLRYEEEHGCAPPADYSITVSTSEMRLLSQEDEGDSHALATGKVVSVETQSLGFTELLCIRILCLPDNENVRLNVYASARVLGDYVPKPGDNIRCQGCLYAAPDALVEGTPWLDSGEVGSNQQQRDAMLHAFQVYDQYAEQSMGMAAVISALAEEGWELFENYWPYSNLFCARNQLGEAAVFSVITTINGRESEEAFTAERLATLDARIELAAGRFALRVGIDYINQAERYSFKLLDDGGFGSALSLPKYAGRAYSPTTLCLDSDECSERRNYPEQLDEAEMARRFARCVAEKDWEELARWLLEEMEYRSDTNGQTCNSKQDFMAYLSARRDMWEERGYWKDQHFSTGTIEYEGSRRPCVALWHLAQITVMTIFENEDGLVRAIHNLSPAQYPDFEECAQG